MEFRIFYLIIRRISIKYRIVYGLRLLRNDGLIQTLFIQVVRFNYNLKVN